MVLVDRAHEQVVGALIRLGCVVAREDDWHVVIVRGATIIQYVPKTIVPADIQRRILKAFAIGEERYFAALHTD